MKHNAIIVSGFLTLVGAMMPLATKGDMARGLSQLSNLSLLLWLLPFLLIGLGIAGKMDKLNEKPWVLSLSIIGLVLSAGVIYGSIEALKSMDSGFGSMFGQLGVSTAGKASVGLGGIVLIISYLASLVAGFLLEKRELGLKAG